jgi:hypothetical protein
VNIWVAPGESVTVEGVTVTTVGVGGGGGWPLFPFPLSPEVLQATLKRMSANPPKGNNRLRTTPPFYDSPGPRKKTALAPN